MSEMALHKRTNEHMSIPEGAAEHFLRQVSTPEDELEYAC